MTSNLLRKTLPQFIAPTTTTINLHVIGHITISSSLQNEEGIDVGYLNIYGITKTSTSPTIKGGGCSASYSSYTTGTGMKAKNFPLVILN